MHPQSPPLTSSRTVLKESDDLVILGVTFDCKMSFEKNLHSVSSAASQRLGILRKSWQVFHNKFLLGRCFRGFVLAVLEYCSSVWCSTADIHLNLLDRVVSGASFLTGCGIESDLEHRRSVAVLCMLYKIKCNPMHPLCDALPEPYGPVRVKRGAVIAHRYTYAPLHRRTSQHRRTFITLAVSFWNDLADPVFHGVGLASFKSRPNPFLLAYALYPYYSLLQFFNFSSFCLLVGIVGLGSTD